MVTLYDTVKFTMIVCTVASIVGVSQLTGMTVTESLLVGAVCVLTGMFFVMVSE